MSSWKRINTGQRKAKKKRRELNSKGIVSHLLTHADESKFMPVVASEPTAHPPGTVEKIAVMAARVAMGEEPHHEADCHNYENMVAAIPPYNRGIHKT